MKERMGLYNNTPQPDLGELSPVQVRRLLDRADWIDSNGAIQLRRDVPLAALEKAETFRNVRKLMQYAFENDGFAATDAGNLKLVVVAELIERMGLDPEERRTAGTKRITEQDMWPLHEARILAELEGLLERQSARFVPAHAELLDEQRAGELFARIFRTCFRRFNLAYGRYTEWPELQHQIGYTLHRLGSVARDWTTGRTIFDSAVLPFARDCAPRAELFDLATSTLESHVLDRLNRFGLVESRNRHRDQEISESSYRITPLFTRFLNVNI